MGDDFAVGLSREFGALGLEFTAQFGEILDDAVVHDGELFGGMRMGVVLGRAAVRRPSGVADADCARERLALQPLLQVFELALGTPARQRAGFDRGDAGRIIAAIFETLERLKKLRRNRFIADNSDNAAHRSGGSP